MIIILLKNNLFINKENIFFINIMKTQYGGLKYTPAQQFLLDVLGYLLKGKLPFLTSFNSNQLVQLDKIKRDPNIMQVLKRLDQPEIAEQSINKINIIKSITKVIDESDLPYTEIRKIISQSDKLTDVVVQIVSANNRKKEKVENKEEIVEVVEVIDNSKTKKKDLSKEEIYLQLIQQAKIKQTIQDAKQQYARKPEQYVDQQYRIFNRNRRTYSFPEIQKSKLKELSNRIKRLDSYFESQLFRFRSQTRQNQVEQKRGRSTIQRSKDKNDDKPPYDPSYYDGSYMNSKDRLISNNEEGQNITQQATSIIEVANRVHNDLSNYIRSIQDQNDRVNQILQNNNFTSEAKPILNECSQLQNELETYLIYIKEQQYPQIQKFREDNKEVLDKKTKKELKNAEKSVRQSKTNIKKIHKEVILNKSTLKVGIIVEEMQYQSIDGSMQDIKNKVIKFFLETLGIIREFRDNNKTTWDTFKEVNTSFGLIASDIAIIYSDSENTSNAVQEFLLYVYEQINEIKQILDEIYGMINLDTDSDEESDIDSDTSDEELDIDSDISELGLPFTSRLPFASRLPLTATPGLPSTATREELRLAGQLSSSALL
jgi:hypothetical protein